MHGQLSWTEVERDFELKTPGGVQVEPDGLLYAEVLKLFASAYPLSV